MDHFQITEPCDDTNLLLAQQAIRLNLYERLTAIDGKTETLFGVLYGHFNGHFFAGSSKMVHIPSILLAAKNFVTAFRAGTFGPVLFDRDRLKWSEFFVLIYSLACDTILFNYNTSDFERKFICSTLPSTRILVSYFFFLLIKITFILWNLYILELSNILCTTIPRECKDNMHTMLQK